MKFDSGTGASYSAALHNADLGYRREQNYFSLLSMQYPMTAEQIRMAAID